MRYNEQVAIDLDISLEDDYVLSKIEDMQNTVLIKEGDRGAFSFNLTNLFKRCPMVFKQVNQDCESDEVKKIYETNKKKFQKMIKGSLGKAILRDEVKRTKDGKKESYFKFNKVTMTILKNGYPTKNDTDFTEIEKLVISELNLTSISKGISTQLASMDIDILKEAIEVAKEAEITDYAYVKGIYNNLIDNKKAASACDTNNLKNKNNVSIIDNKSISEEEKNNKPICKKSKNTKQSIPNVKTRFHNINESFRNYTPEELEIILLESQKDKFK